MSRWRPPWRWARHCGRRAVWRVLVELEYAARLSRSHARLAAFDRERFQRRDGGVRVVGIRDHAHLHLHVRTLQIDTDITAPPALEEMDMRVVGQRLRDQFVRRPV